jgi:hypothetical protein
MYLQFRRLSYGGLIAMYLRLHVVAFVLKPHCVTLACLFVKQKETLKFDKLSGV